MGQPVVSAPKGYTNKQDGVNVTPYGRLVLRRTKITPKFHHLSWHGTVPTHYVETQLVVVTFFTYSFKGNMNHTFFFSFSTSDDV